MEGNKAYAYKVVQDNIIKKVEIKTGMRTSGNVEIISGLQENDKIVAEGLAKTRPGAKIKPIISKN